MLLEHIGTGATVGRGGHVECRIVGENLRRIGSCSRIARAGPEGEENDGGP